MDVPLPLSMSRLSSTRYFEPDLLASRRVLWIVPYKNALSLTIFQYFSYTCGWVQVLKVEHIDYDIRRLVINQDGKLLAVVGDEKIVVAVLPKAIRQDPKATHCKSFVVGEFYHINKGPSKIVKVLWHPLSRGYTHLLVMTHDSTLRYSAWDSEHDLPQLLRSYSKRICPGTLGCTTLVKTLTNPNRLPALLESGRSQAHMDWMWTMQHHSALDRSTHRGASWRSIV